jgi:3-oxoadipate enol-lactonase
MNVINAGVVPFYQRIESAGGDRPWLVMIHGASQHRGVFSAQVEYFQHQYRLLLIDLPGHGGSARLAGPYGLIEYAESALAALNDAGITQMHFWGTHTGAGIGLLLAARGHQHRFKSLILDGAVLPGADMPSIAATISRAKASARTQGVAAARVEWFNEAEWFAVMRKNPVQCRAATHWAIVQGFAGGPWLDTLQPRPVESIEDNLPGIEIPTLLMNGEHDVSDFLRVAHTIAAALPNVQQFIVPGGGGFPLWESPALVNERVRAFLAQVSD